MTHDHITIAAEPAAHLVETVMFAGLCELCLWQGQPRRNNLTALGDYDRHLLTSAHNMSVLQRTMLHDEDEDEDPDGSLA